LTSGDDVNLVLAHVICGAECPHTECKSCDLDGKLMPTCTQCNVEFTVATGSCFCEYTFN